jgi:site-specific recombinase
MRNLDQQKNEIAKILSTTGQKGLSVDECVDSLIKLVSIFRPAKATTTVSISPLLEVIQKDSTAKEVLQNMIQQLLYKRRFAVILTDNGILKDTRFFSEIRDRIIAKFLPEQPEKDTLEYLLNQLFYKDNDYIWVELIPHSELFDLAHILGISSIYKSIDDNTPMAELINTISLIMQRSSGRALESEVLKMVPKYVDRESPFEAFEKEFDLIVKEIRKDKTHAIQSSDIGYKQLHILLKQCYEFIETAFESSKNIGISIRVNQIYCVFVNNLIGFRSSFLCWLWIMMKIAEIIRFNSLKSLFATIATKTTYVNYLKRVRLPSHLKLPSTQQKPESITSPMTKENT